MKLVPAVRAVIAAGAAKNPVLHVTLNAVPRDWSSCTMISLLAVTAVVLTVTDVAVAATVNAPAEADPHTAGEAELAQFVPVATLLAVMVRNFRSRRVPAVTLLISKMPAAFLARHVSQDVASVVLEPIQNRPVDARETF